MDTKCFSALIDGFYAAALEPDRWSAAAAQMACFFDSESTVVKLRKCEISNIAMRATTPNYDQAAHRDYAAYFHKLDPFANGWLAIGAAPGVYAGHQLVDPEAFRKSEIYNDFCRRLGIFHTLGAGADLGDTTNLIISIHRPIEREDFAAEDRHKLEFVLPHLSRAMQVQKLLATAGRQEHLANEIFEALSLATMIVDAECRIAFTNSVADQMLKANDGLRVRQARLTTSDPQLEVRLLREVRYASAISSGGVAPIGHVLSVRRTHKPPLSVLVAPLRRDLWTSGPKDASVVIFANDPESRQPPATAVLTALYRLTPAEARLMEALLQGERIAEYTDRVGISINTANTHLKQIFAKTDTNRQTDLMRLILSDPITSLAGPQPITEWLGRRAA